MQVLRAGRPGWTSLGATPSELLLDYTLPTGQTFRWRKTAPDQYTGVIQGRVVSAWRAISNQELQLFRSQGRLYLRRSCGDAWDGIQVVLQQHDTDVAYRVLARAPGLSAHEEAELIHDYFNLSTKLAPMATRWSESDTRFSTLHKLIQGTGLPASGMRCFLMPEHGL